MSPACTLFNLCKCVKPCCCRVVFYMQESGSSLLRWVSLQPPVINPGNCTWEFQTCIFAQWQNVMGCKGSPKTTGWKRLPDHTSPRGHILNQFFAQHKRDGPQKYMRANTWKNIETENFRKQNQVVLQTCYKAKMTPICESAFTRWGYVGKTHCLDYLLDSVSLYKVIIIMQL